MRTHGHQKAICGGLFRVVRALFSPVCMWQQIRLLSLCFVHPSGHRRLHTHICPFLALGLHTHPQGAHQLLSWEGERGTSVGGLEAVVLSEMDVINTCWVDRETDPWESQLASQKSLLSLFLSVSWWSSFTQSNTFKRQERHFQGDQRHFSHYFSTEGSWNQIYRIKQRQCSEKPLNNN